MDSFTCTYGGIAINKFFDAETPIWAMFGKMADIAVLSFLWTLCSIPIITMGASSAALMRCSLNMNSGEGNWRARNFFRYFRSNLRNATLLWLVFLFAAAVLTVDLLILSGAGTTGARVQKIIAVLGMVLWMMNAVWAFALTSLFENSLVQTIKNAFYIGMSYLPRTVVMCVLWALPAGLLAFAPDIFSRVVVLWPVLFFGGTAYFCAKLMIKPLTPYYDALSHPAGEESEESSDGQES